MGLGDYQHDFNYEGEFDPWMSSLWLSLDSVLKGKFIKTGDLKPEEANLLLPPIYKVEIIGSDDKLCTLDKLPPPNGALSPKVFLSSVVSNSRITSEDHFQDTRHIVLKMDST